MGTLKDFDKEAAEKARKESENFAWDSHRQFCTALEMVVPGQCSDSDPQRLLAQAPMK